MSENVVECPNCRRQVDEAHAVFAPVREPPVVGRGQRFRVKHIVPGCGHEWVADHRDFYRRGEAPPRPINPFGPIGRW